jgi:hemerythrin-like domain-containing protein
LLLAVRLQQGERALQRLWRHDFFWQAEYIVTFYHDLLASHFKAEEKVLFPIAQQYLTKDAKIIKQLLNEHEVMRSLVKYFRKPQEKELEAKLKYFGKILEQHIRYEERQFFPLCEEKIPPIGWQTIKERLDAFFLKKNDESKNQQPAD